MSRRELSDLIWTIPGRVICAVILGALEFRDRHRSP